MKKKIIIISSILLLALPAVNFALNDEHKESQLVDYFSNNEGQLLAEKDKTNFTSSNLKLDNPSLSNSSEKSYQLKDDVNKNQLNSYGNVLNNTQNSNYPNVVKGWMGKSASIIDIVKQFAPEQLLDWEQVIAERFEIDAQISRQRNQLEGRGFKHGKGHYQRMMLRDDTPDYPIHQREHRNEIERERLCHNLENLVASGAELAIKNELEEMLTHWQDRNLFKKEQLANLSK